MISIPVGITALNAELSAIEESLGMINTSLDAVNELQTAISRGLMNISTECSAAMINCSGLGVMAAVNNLDVVKASRMHPLFCATHTADKICMHLDCAHVYT